MEDKDSNSVSAQKIVLTTAVVAGEKAFIAIVNAIILAIVNAIIFALLNDLKLS
jgi:hypothetical protein